MALTISATLLFGLLTFVLIRGRSVHIGTALVLFLFGFFTAGTGAAAFIRAACSAVASAVTHITA